MVARAVALVALALLPVACTASGSGPTGTMGSTTGPTTGVTTNPSGPTSSRPPDGSAASNRHPVEGPVPDVSTDDVDDDVFGGLGDPRQSGKQPHPGGWHSVPER